MAKRTALAEGYNIQIQKEIFNAVYLPYLETINRYEIYFGGSGSGKSVFIAQKLALQITLMEGRNLICLRKQGTDAKESVFPEICSALDQMGLIDLWDVVEHPSPRLTCNAGPGKGNVIMFSGLDSAENIKSIKFKKGKILTDIWYEEATEELDMKNMRELNRRLRGLGWKKRLILSFNPVYVGHPIKDYIENELIKGGSDVMMLKTTYKDNRFLSAEDISEIEKFQFTDPYSWMVYGLGMWGTTGRTVFNANLVNGRIQRLKEIYEEMQPQKMAVSFERDEASGQPKKDTFQTYKFRDGEATIYEHPKPGYPYVAAFDTAGEGSDYYAMHIINNVTDEQVCVYHSGKMPNVCIFQIFGLLKYYNNALVAPEVNFDSYPLEKLQELGYSNIYRRDAHPENMNAQVEAKLGFRTTPENRQRILDELVDWVDQNIDKINDIDTLMEMLTFTRQKAKQKGIFWAAEPGAHDDLIISLAILLVAKEQQRAYIKEEKKVLEGFYFPEEIDFMTETKSITNKEAVDYKKQSLSLIGVGASRPVKSKEDLPW